MLLKIIEILSYPQLPQNGCGNDSGGSAEGLAWKIKFNPPFSAKWKAL